MCEITTPAKVPKTAIIGVACLSKKVRKSILDLGCNIMKLNPISRAAVGRRLKWRGYASNKTVNHIFQEKLRMNFFEV